MSNSATAPTSTTASSTNSASELPTSEVTVPGRTPIEIVACGALAGHVRAIAAAHASGGQAVLAYADCGTYGALDDLSAATGAKRLPGLHCYDLYAGRAQIAQLFAEEPGTYLLTDYLIRSFDRSVIQPLGLDRHPELWTDYFGHYTRLVWLAQEATSELDEAAAAIASRFNLPLTRIDTGTTGLEAALAVLLEEQP